jgi:hypothetical protein
MLPLGSPSWNVFVVVLTVRYPADGVPPRIGGQRSDEWEIPFLCPRTEFRRYNNAYRRAVAERLRAAIEDLMLGRYAPS